MAKEQSPNGVAELEAEEELEFPTEFIATTVKVYAVPAVKPVKVQLVEFTFVHPAGAVTNGDEVTEYPVIADPPFEAGAVQEIVACLYPAVPVTEVGAPGTVAGITADDALDATESPATLVATTVNV